MLKPLLILSVFFHTLSPEGGLSHEGIRAIQTDQDGFAWFLLREDVVRYDGYEYISYATRVSNSSNETIFFRDIREVNGDLLLYTTTGEYIYNAQKDSFVINRLSHPIEQKKVVNPTNIPGARVSCFDKDSNLWIGTYDGLCMIDAKSGEMSRYRVEDNIGLVNNSIWSLHCDDNNNIWIGTYSGGINLLSLETSTPFFFSKLDDDATGFPVSSLAQQDSVMWVSLVGKGLLQLRRHNGHWEHVKTYQHSEKNNSVSSNHINSILLHNNDLYIGSYLGGLDCLDTRTGNIKHILLSGNERSVHIIKLIADDSDGFWILLIQHNQELGYYNYHTHEMVFISFPDISQNFETRYFVDAVSASQGKLYLAASNCIYQADISTRTITAIYDLNHPVRSLFYDLVEHKLWIGTIRSGLLSLNMNSLEVDIFADILTYDDPTISSLIEDNNGDVWMGTNRGIIRFSPSNGRWHRYENRSSQRFAPYYPLASLKDNTGKLYFGMNGGITWFNPDDIRFNHIPPKILFSNKPPTDRIPYNENSVTFTLASTNYLQSSKNQYRYRLVGYQNIWKEMDSRQRTIRYEKLPVGHYRFEAATANNDGVWGPVGTFSFQIRPSWWNGWWAWLIYTLLVIGIITYVIYVSLKHRKVQNELYKAQVRQAEEEKASRAQIRFFTDLDKELRAPLLKLLENSDEENAVSIREMLQTMNQYTQKYCIDTGNRSEEIHIERQLDQLTQLIDQRMSQHIDIDLLARDMGMSRRKLYNFVKDNTGKSVIEYIRLYRISTATKLMLEEDLSTKEIMDRVGFESQSYFVRIFRQEYGLTPTEFIANMRQKNTNPDEQPS